MKRTTRLPNGHILKATACLQAANNQTPYFSLQGEERNPRIRRDDGIVCCGCMHDELVRHWPDLKELALLHLSDINGVPMHAEANGWYWLAGALGGLSEHYHGSRGSSNRTRRDCFRIFMDHVRISRPEAIELVRSIMKTPAKRYGRDDIGYDRNNQKRRAVFHRWIECQKPRWKREADAAIARFGLEVTKG